MAKAVSEGRRDFVRIAIAGRGAEFCVPCGACRQALHEFAPDIRVLVTWGDAQRGEALLPELLPKGFGPKDLPET